MLQERKGGAQAGEKIRQCMNDPAGENRTIRLFFIDIAHTIRSGGGESEDKQCFCDRNKPEKKSSMQDAEQDRLYGIGKRESEHRLQALQEKPTEQDFLG